MNAPVDGFNLPNILVPVSGLSLYEYAFAVEAIGKFQEYSTGPVNKGYVFTDDAGFVIKAAGLVKDYADDFISLGFESDIILLLPRAVETWKVRRQKALVKKDSKEMRRLYKLWDDMNYFSDSFQEFVILLEQSDNEAKNAIWPYLTLYETYVKRLDVCCAKIDPLLKAAKGRKS